MYCLLASFIIVHMVLSVPLNVSENTREPAVSFNQFPYQVLISELDDAPKCGGVSIADGFIVTSATCVLKFGGIRKFLEEAVLYGGGSNLLFVLGDVVDASIHPKYMFNSVTFDVAVIRFVPEEKAPHLHPTIFNGSRSLAEQESCIMTSWWSVPEPYPNKGLIWESVSVVQCSPPDPNFLCFSDGNIEFLENDYGSPIVCDGILTGLIPSGGGKRAINLTESYEWINKSMTEMTQFQEPHDESIDENTKSYFDKILHKLDLLSRDQSWDSEGFDNSFSHWNKQVVVPLSYVLLSLVTFFFLLLFFIIVFTVVLVYYSRN